MIKAEADNVIRFGLLGPHMPVTDQIEAELHAGRQALAAGNPGRARVCARRAAGLGIKDWYQRRASASWTGDALRQLQRLQAEPTTPAPVRAAAARLTTKVDRDHRLPFADDPLDDAQLILAYVRPEGTAGFRAR
jgi:hypothetical protein